MVKTAQSKIGLTTMFVVLFGFIPTLQCNEQRGREENDYRQREAAPT